MPQHMRSDAGQFSISTCRFKSGAEGLVSTYVVGQREDPFALAPSHLLETLGRADDKLAKLRTVGAQTLLTAGLSSRTQVEIDRGWESRWEQASEPLIRLDSSEPLIRPVSLAVWRCGGAAFAIGDSSHQGRSISEP